MRNQLAAVIANSSLFGNGVFIYLGQGRFHKVISGNKSINLESYTADTRNFLV